MGVYHVLYVYTIAFLLRSLWDSWNTWVSDSFAFSWTFFLLFGFLFFYFILFCYVLLSLRSLLFSYERQREVEPDGREGREELEGLEGDQTVIGIYCLREESIFNEMKKKIVKTKTKMSGKKSLPFLEGLNLETRVIIIALA